MTMTCRDGRVVKMENVFLRGGLVKFIVLPELLKNAPVFKKVHNMHKRLDKSKGPGAPAANKNKKQKTK